MSLRSDLAANRWMRAQFAVLVLAAVYVPVAAALSLAFGTLWALAPVAAYAPAGGVCWVGARRTDRALTAVRAVEAAKFAELHTPRCPDAEPDQCPVCGGEDLPDRAKDDEALGRDPDRCIVVPYGPSQRAHRDCAEMAPYVEPQAPHFEPFEIDGHRMYCACKQCNSAADRNRAYYRCRFCGFYRFASSKDAAREKLIAHSKECPKRPQVAAGEARGLTDLFLPKGFKLETQINPGRVFTSRDGMQYFCGGQAESETQRPPGSLDAGREQSVNAAWCERQAEQIAEETRRRWQS